jgi:hypothetical protein
MRARTPPPSAAAHDAASAGDAAPPGGRGEAANLRDASGLEQDQSGERAPRGPDAQLDRAIARGHVAGTQHLELGGGPHARDEREEHVRQVMR